jgi:hypothetical protein
MILSYLIPIFLRVTLARKWFKKGPVHMGRFSYPLAYVALIWGLFISVRGRRGLRRAPGFGLLVCSGLRFAACPAACITACSAGSASACCCWGPLEHSVHWKQWDIMMSNTAPGERLLP